MTRQYITYYLTAFLLLTIFGQTFCKTTPAKVWASVYFNKKQVMIGEPLVVTVTIYTNTWFTAPPDYGEIRVPRSLMVKLEQRGGATTKTIGKKKYPAIEQKFVIYPGQIGENIMPPIKIDIESPDEGDYKGRKRTIQSPERKFTVLPPPEGMDQDNWLTAYDVRITETWDQSLDNLKEGDVLQRRITINARGALAALIPPIEFSELDYASIYPQNPLLTNIQHTTSFSGRRVEIVTYLLEKEGTDSIPEISLSWFKPQTKELMTTNLPAKEITIARNPNLEFMLSMQDSLNALLAAQAPAEEPEPFSFMGMNWWQLILVLVSILSFFYLIIKGIFRLIRFSERKKKMAQESEEHYLKILHKSSRANDKATFMKDLMFWYDRFRGEIYKPQFQDFIKRSEDEGLREESYALEKSIYSDNDEDKGGSTMKSLYRSIRKARKKTRQRKKKAKKTLQTLNP